ncbi:MotE family protein [Primorskyibacter sp. 2E233]|uniref:MotE family protein n=1 Tax=Primorskyibacter sp. 2E233 TaxID=3413431 RepID=UPI003BF29530
MAIAKTSKPSVPTVKKKPRRRMRGALTAIGGLLIASAVLRTAVGASEAFAREEPATNLAAGASSEGDVMAANAHALATDSHPPGGGDHSTPVKRVAEADIMPLIEALNKREARIKQREADIDVRMQALSLAEQEIDRKMAELEAAEQKLRGTLALAQTAAEDDISRLTDVYANMKPKQAAALFEEMDPEFAAGFLGRMRSDAAAAIMAGLTPSAAYTISVVLAGRNAEVPKN